MFNAEQLGQREYEGESILTTPIMHLSQGDPRRLINISNWTYREISACQRNVLEYKFNEAMEVCLKLERADSPRPNYCISLKDFVYLACCKILYHALTRQGIQMFKTPDDMLMFVREMAKRADVQETIAHYLVISIWDNNIVAIARKCYGAELNDKNIGEVMKNIELLLTGWARLGNNFETLKGSHYWRTK